VGVFAQALVALAQDVTPTPLTSGQPVATTVEVIVTGSNIPTAEEVGPQPVDTYRRVDIERLGVRSATDFVQKLPVATGPSINENVNTLGNGQTEIDLRGLAAKETLVLQDGRRLAPDGFAGYYNDLNAFFGSEYCRSNIEVSLGTYDPGADGKQHQQKKIPEDPKLAGSAYEKDLVQYGFKWSPVKVYRREMSRVQGQTWRLDLSVEHRSGQPAEPQRAALIITVADPLKKAPVYNEMVVQMNNLGWTANDLQVRTRLRQ